MVVFKHKLNEPAHDPPNKMIRWHFYSDVRRKWRKHRHWKPTCTQSEHTQTHNACVDEPPLPSVYKEGGQWRRQENRNVFNNLRVNWWFRQPFARVWQNDDRRSCPRRWWRHAVSVALWHVGHAASTSTAVEASPNPAVGRNGGFVIAADTAFVRAPLWRRWRQSIFESNELSWQTIGDFLSAKASFLGRASFKESGLKRGGLNPPGKGSVCFKGWTHLEGKGHFTGFLMKEKFNVNCKNLQQWKVADFWTD